MLALCPLLHPVPTIRGYPECGRARGTFEEVTTANLGSFVYEVVSMKTSVVASASKVAPLVIAPHFRSAIAPHCGRGCAQTPGAMQRVELPTRDWREMAA